MIDPIRVVIADDSPFIRGLITSYLETAGGFEVIGTAGDGKDAVSMVERLQPDVVTLDVDMPTMCGLEALNRIMQNTPTPVVMVSGVSIRSAETTLKAIQSGAVDFVLKYVPTAHLNPEEIRLDVISKVRAAANIRVVRTVVSRIPSRSSGNSPQPRSIPLVQFPGDQPAIHTRCRDLVIVGASTGGPVALKQLLGSLPPTFAGSIIVVQHIPRPFTAVLAAQLNSQTPFSAQVAQGGEHCEARRIYIAPGDQHLLLAPDLTLKVHDGPPIRGNRPSIDITMQSVAQRFPYNVHAILLTGMGDDGASGLAYVRSKGGTTYAQSGETCVVNGMPQRAIDMGVVDFVASPEGIASRLTQEIMRQNLLSRGPHESLRADSVRLEATS